MKQAKIASFKVGQNWARTGPEGGPGWPTLAQQRGSNVKTVKNQWLSVAATGPSLTERLSHKNKGFALVCSLLRYVWKQIEVHRAEMALLLPFALRNGRLKPAFGTAEVASTTPSASFLSLFARFVPTLQWPRSLLCLLDPS